MRVAVLSSLVLGSVTSTLGYFCPEAARFGFNSIEPSSGTLHSGQTITITSNYTCSYSKGIRPSEVFYYIVNTVNNNGHEPATLVHHRKNPKEVDVFKAKIPFAPVYFYNASYSLISQYLYPVNGSNGAPVDILAQGGGYVPLKIANTTAGA